MFTKKRKTGKKKLKPDLKDPENKLKCCHICGKFFKHHLEKHLLTHSEKKPFQCDICNKTFKRKNHMKTHTKLIHENTTMHQCDICNKKLRSKDALVFHLKRHTKEYCIKCEKCGFGFVRMFEYRKHVKVKHGVSNFICNVCGVSCCDKTSLERHIARHADDYGKNPGFKCEHCSKSFPQERYLKYHVKRMHREDRKRYICDLCGKEVLSKQSLRDHQLIHTGEKPVECKECGKKFTISTSLKVHMRSHTGERPYECKDCGRRFTQKGSLNTHIRSYHNGERQHNCEICPMSFVTKAMLQRHLMKPHDAL